VLCLIIFLRVFLMAQYGFSIKPKHAASNKTDIISVVVDGRYSLLFMYHNGMSLIKNGYR